MRTTRIVSNPSTTVCETIGPVVPGQGCAIRCDPIAGPDAQDPAPILLRPVVRRTAPLPSELDLDGCATPSVDLVPSFDRDRRNIFRDCNAGLTSGERLL